ncbi:MAG: flagellar assembly peptidoglycan hydrolase FlgJ [Gammaproteobacteria bacterium]|nr:flagellar assembly peptidoglycan hydrolase FlgJ [Gammaproteobacteria bacterium]
MISAPIDMQTMSKFAYTDVNALQRLKGQGAEGIRAAAQQFESLFIDLWLQSMRAAGDSFSEGSYLTSRETKLHQEMLDHQWAIHMAENGGLGLADVIVDQIGSVSVDESQSLSSGQPTSISEGLRIQTNGFKKAQFDSAEAFIEELIPRFRDALEGTPLSAVAVLAQSALETGWGQHIIQKANGDSSHNLFGIKAGADWQGDAVRVRTVEFSHGRPRHEVGEFRRYENWEAAVRDYVALLSGNERYSTVLEHAQDPERFADELQKAGYATDPAYARKLKSVINRVQSFAR